MMLYAIYVESLDRMQRAVDALCESEETRVRVVK